MQNFEIDSTQIDKIKKITTEEKSFRIKNLEFFKATGFPNKSLKIGNFQILKTLLIKILKSWIQKKCHLILKK